MIRFIDSVRHGPDPGKELRKSLRAKSRLSMEAIVPQIIAQVVVMPGIHHNDQRVHSDPLQMPVEFGQIGFVLLWTYVSPTGASVCATIVQSIQTLRVGLSCAVAEKPCEEIVF
eukprot:SAG11_NODE_4960_length_1709_cov_1.572050_2_plen_114_part_00